MQPVDPLARQLAELAEQLLGHKQPEPVVQEIAARAQAMLPDAHHVSVMGRHGRSLGFRTLAATDDVARACDAVQIALGEGPALSGDGADPVHRSGDVGGDTRWRRWGPAAAEEGVRSVLTVRLAARQDHLGSLNLYSRDPFAFGDEDGVELAVLFAGHAAAALAAVTEISGLRAALESRHVIGTAQGMLVERYGLTVNGAFELLKRYSSVHNQKLRDVAARLVETGQFVTGSEGATTGEAARGPQD